jgi:hypothetical protein
MLISHDHKPSGPALPDAARQAGKLYFTRLTYSPDRVSTLIISS